MNKKLIIISLIEFIVLISIFIPISRHYYNKFNTSQHNLIAYQDSLSIVKLNNNQLLYEKNSLILNKKELELKFEDLKQLNKELSNKISYISKIKSQIQIDTILTTRDSIIYKDKYPNTINFNYKSDFITLSGITNIQLKQTKLHNINIPLHLTVGLTDNYTIFVKSDNPYININSIDGAVLDKSKLKQKDKKWRFGVYGGFGVGYDLISKQLGVGPQIGLGILYLF